MGAYGNDNLAFIRGSQFLTIDGSSDTVEIPEGVIAVDLYATTACWVYIGEPGDTPTAAAPGGEKTEVAGFFLPDSLEKSGVPIPLGETGKKVKIAAIQDTTGGTLYVTYRRMT